MKTFLLVLKAIGIILLRLIVGLTLLGGFFALIDLAADALHINGGLVLAGFLGGLFSLYFMCLLVREEYERQASKQRSKESAAKRRPPNDDDMPPTGAVAA